MQASRLAIDPLWSCLCPAWTTATALRAGKRLTTQTRVKVSKTVRPPPTRRTYATQEHHDSRGAADVADSIYKPAFDIPGSSRGENAFDRPPKKRKAGEHPLVLTDTTTKSLYNYLRVAALDGKHTEVRETVEYLVKERREKPSAEHYNALILANTSPDEGAGWRVHDLLAEMQREGLQPDNATCHAVLKVLSVHTDYLLRADILMFMRSNWIDVSEHGLHDIAAGLLREGRFEQALERLDDMKRQGITVKKWLLDMFVYTLCEAGETEEAYNIMHIRHSSGELNLSRTLWSHFLDSASASHHFSATSLAWKTQVNVSFLNPSSAVCLNVLTTAARAGDAALATDCFGHLAKRGSPFGYLHYQLLTDAYLNASPPDVKRALSILPIMLLEKLKPGPGQTRGLYKLLRSSSDLTTAALQHLRDLHTQGRKIPIAALNLLIESWVDQRNLPEAMKIYKLIHTFTPINEGPKPTFANIETFNLLLRGCRTADPPDEEQASFLVSELLALKVKPTALTYDRLILVFTAASRYHLENADENADFKDKARILLDWATRHFFDMQPLGWMPRFGTIETLSRMLAHSRDDRCWDILQMAEDAGNDKVEGWDSKGKWARKKVEEEWTQSDAAKSETQNAFDVEEAQTSSEPQVVEGVGSVTASAGS